MSRRGREAGPYLAGRVVAAALLLLPGALHGQGLDACRWAGPDPVGIGIERLRCVGGECEINVEVEDGRLEHRFTTEPRIEALWPNSPAPLEVGDVVVSVDGSPVTTAEAGRRLARLTAGRTVALGLRRDDRYFVVRLTPRRGCPIGGLEVRRPTGDDPDA